MLACFAAPAAAVDHTQYPSAIAADAAAMMAKFGGVVIDVQTRFPGDKRAFTAVGCADVKRDPQVLLADAEGGYDFTHCGPDLTVQRTFELPPRANEPVTVPSIETIREPSDYPQ
jgi:hypothetical protein